MHFGILPAVVLDHTAFASGSLRLSSYVRPGKLFTASGDLMTEHVGHLTEVARIRIVNAVVAWLRRVTPADAAPDPA